MAGRARNASLGLVPEDLEEEALKTGPVGVDQAFPATHRRRGCSPTAWSCLQVITLEAGATINCGDVIDAAG